MRSRRCERVSVRVCVRYVYVWMHAFAVFVRVCACLRLCVCLRVCMCVFARARARVCVCARARTRTHTHTRACAQIYTHSQTHTYENAPTHAYIRGQFSGGQFSWGAIFRGAIIRGAIFLGQFSGSNFPGGGNFPGGSFPGGNFPGGNFPDTDLFSNIMNKTWILVYSEYKTPWFSTPTDFSKCFWGYITNFHYGWLKSQRNLLGCKILKKGSPGVEFLNLLSRRVTESWCCKFSLIPWLTRLTFSTHGLQRFWVWFCCIFKMLRQYTWYFHISNL